MADRTFTRPPDAVDPMEAWFHDGLSEKVFMERLMTYARKNGWRVFHDLDSRKNEEGFLDILMTNGRVIYLVELKSEKGKVSKKQQAWIDDLESSVTHEVRVWRPSDYKAFVEVIEDDPRDPQPR